VPRPVRPCRAGVRGRRLARSAPPAFGELRFELLVIPRALPSSAADGLPCGERLSDDTQRLIKLRVVHNPDRGPLRTVRVLRGLQLLILRHRSDPARLEKAPDVRKHQGIRGRQELRSAHAAQGLRTSPCIVCRQHGHPRSAPLQPEDANCSSSS